MSYACRHQFTGAMEQLNRNIIRLGEKMESLRNRDVDKNSTIPQWQQKWSAKKSLLDQHFESIEEKLANLKSSKQEIHRLSIFNVPPDSDGMTSMGPF